MYQNFFNHINIQKNNIHILNGMTTNYEEECNVPNEELCKRYSDPHATCENCQYLIKIKKDIEDAIRLNIIDKSDVPKNIVETLGINNKDIINTQIYRQIFFGTGAVRAV